MYNNYSSDYFGAINYNLNNYYQYTVQTIMIGARSYGNYYLIIAAMNNYNNIMIHISYNLNLTIQQEYLNWFLFFVNRIYQLVN